MTQEEAIRDIKIILAATLIAVAGLLYILCA
jgi:hypothetical protein